MREDPTPPLERCMGVGKQQRQFAFNSSSENYSHMSNDVNPSYSVVFQSD